MTSERPSLDELRQTFRSFKRSTSLLRDLVRDPSADLSLSYRLKFTKDQAAETAFTKGADVGRHAALLRPFMAPGSPIELRRVRDALQAAGIIDEERRSSIEAAFGEAERLSIALKINGAVLSSRDVYTAYAEGEYHGEDEEARQRLADISVGPMQGLILMLFHEACERYTRLVFLLLDVILDIERALPSGELETEKTGPCIYCLTFKLGPASRVLLRSAGGGRMRASGPRPPSLSDRPERNATPCLLMMRVDGVSAGGGMALLGTW